MDTPSNDFRPLRSASPTLSPAFRLQRRYLGQNLFPSSPLSRCSGPSEADDLDELDEQDIWDASFEDSGSSADLAKGQASLPPRVSSAGKKGGGRSVTPERRSPVTNGSVPWAWTAVKGLNSVSGLSTEVHGGRDTARRLVGVESSSRRIPTASRMIPRLTTEEKSSSNENIQEVVRQGIPQSAPVNIPYWSKVDKNESSRGKWVRGNDEENDEEDQERLPPHEFLAREYARSQMMSFSVLEGAGRTLKGRDVSRVRDAVLTRTGFLD